MSDDQKIGVTIAAAADGFKSGLKEAAAAAETFAAQVKGHLGSLAEPFEKLNRTLVGIAAIAAGGAVFKEIINSTVEAVGETRKLSVSFGISLEAASELRTGLNVLGIGA